VAAQPREAPSESAQQIGARNGGIAGSLDVGSAAHALGFSRRA
jgi:hypothetical protein